MGDYVERVREKAEAAQAAKAAPAARPRKLERPTLETYLDLQLNRIRVLVKERLAVAAWPDPAVDVPFAAAGERRFGEVLGARLAAALVDTELARRMVFPDDLAEPFARFVLAAGVGKEAFIPAFGMAVAMLLERSAIASLRERSGPRLRLALASRARLPEADDLLASHPIDPYVAGVLVIPGVVDVTQVAATEREAVAKPRAVTVTWIGRAHRELWNFVDVRPGSATAEEVALALWGSTTMAYALTGHGGVFEVQPAEARALIAQRFPGEVIGPETSHAAQVAALAGTEHGVREAREQRTGVPGPILTEEQLRDVEAKIGALLGQIREALRPVGMDSLLIPAFVARTQRVAVLAQADAAARAQWSAVLIFQHAQLLALAKAVPSMVDELRTMMVPDDALSPARRERRDQVRADLETYVQAAAVSHLRDESNELVARVEGRRRRAGLDALDGGTIELAESTRGLTDRDTRARRNLATVEAELATQRTAELHGKASSPYEHERTLIAAGELALSQRIEAADDALIALKASADGLDMRDRTAFFGMHLPGSRSVPDMIADVRARLADVHRVWDTAEQDASGVAAGAHAPEGWAEWEARSTALAAARKAFAQIAGDQSLSTFFAAAQSEIHDEQVLQAFAHAGQALLLMAVTMGVGAAADFAIAELVAEGASLGSRVAGTIFAVGFNATINAGIQYAMSNGTESLGRLMLVNALGDLGTRGILKVLRTAVKSSVEEAKAIAALPHLTQAEAAAVMKVEFSGTEAMVELVGSLGAQWAAEKLVSLTGLGKHPGEAGAAVSDSLAATVLEQGVAIALGRFFAGRIHAWQQHRERFRQLGFDRAQLDALIAARDQFFADAQALAANPSPDPGEAAALASRDGELMKQERAVLSTPLTDEQRALIAKATSDAPPRGEKEHNSFQPHELQDVRRWMNHGIDEGANKAKEHPADATPKDNAALAFREDAEVQRWFERWLELPDRIIVHPDGSVDVRLPKETPPRVADILRLVIPETNAILMSRAMAMEERIARELPGVSLDPMAPDWLATRKRLVEMFGDERVRGYEASKGGVVDTKVAERMDQVLAVEARDRLRAAFPDVEIYITGSASQPEKTKQGTADLDVVVVVPEGTPPRARAEMEQRLNAMTVRARGDGAAALPVDAKVMTPREFAGASMLETPAGRTPLRYARVDGGVGPHLGTGETGIDLHSHLMGVPATRYFLARIGGGSAATTLELAWTVVEDGKVPVSAEVKRQVGVAIADVRNARQVAMPEAIVEARATRALDAVLSASAETPFDHTYDLRDALVQAYIDPHGTYENFATDVLQDLSAQGVTYSEQSVSAGKLDKRFTPEAMDNAHRRAGANDTDLRFLVMVPTDASLAASDPKSTREALRRQMLRRDVRGVDVAGPEHGRFTEEGLRWFRDVIELAREVSREKGEAVVVRPHVGEGYDPHATGEHVDVARYNLEKMIGALEDLGYRPADGVVVRLGHATHSTSAQRGRMAALGVIVESNVGSNLATGSILHADEHPILAQMFDGVATVLATDAQGVMSTNLPLEYQRVASLIEQFRAGKPLEIDGRQHHWAELTDAQRARFSIDWLRQQLSSYMEGVK